MNKTKIAAGMIVKNDSEAEMLMRCLNTVAPFVDGIFLTITSTPHKKLQSIAKRYGVNVDLRPDEFFHVVTKKEVKWLKKFFGYSPIIKPGDKIFNFGKARQANLDFIPKDFEWLFWVDTDDIVRQGQMLHMVADNAYKMGAEAVFLNYLYQVETGDAVCGQCKTKKSGIIKNIIIQHLRERLVRIDGDYRKVYRWEGAIHETLIQQRETKKIEDKRVDVVHLSNQERFSEALKRNMRTLETEVYERKGKDPRPLYYLGKAYYDWHTDEGREKAAKLIMVYLSPESHKREMSGWREERSQAWEYLGNIYREKGQHNNSITCYANALIEYPQFPSTYFSMATSHMLKQDYDTARFWAMIGSQIPQPTSTLVTNPRDITAQALETVYNSAVHTNRIDEAYGAATELKKLFPQDRVINDRLQWIDNARRTRDALKDYMKVVNHLKTTGEGAKVKALLEAAPLSIADNPMVVKLAQEYNPPRKWDKDEITFYLGQQFTVWSPKTIKDPGGSFVGGSEEATIYLTRELTKLGWKVTVYADPGEDEGKHDGVTWIPWYRFNQRDKFNILVSWRQIALFDLNLNTKKSYLWLHDVANPAEYNKERLKKIAKVIPLSKAHRDNIPDVKDDKIMISSNGYFEHFPKLKPKNDPLKCIWTSSYDRGLEHLLEIWPDVKKVVPKAELHVFYGWQLFQNFYKDNPERMAWMRKMEQMMKADGITHHGRVSQLDIEKWHKKCGIWAYPSHFYEINCISAIKSQLWGCVPVCIDYAALNTTVKYGKKIKGDIWDSEVKEEYKKELIKALKNPKWQAEQRKKMMPWAKKKFGWKGVARQWSDEFRKNSRNSL